MSGYVIAYSFYEKYATNLLSQVAAVCKYANVKQVIFVSTNKLDLAEKFECDSGLKCATVNLSHNNDFWEFGGYQVGLDYLRTRIDRQDSLYIMNDTAGIHSFLPVWIVRRFAKLTSSCSGTDAPAIVGELDEHNTDLDLSVLDLEANKWIRSCVFSLNYAAIEAISWNFNHSEFFHGISQKNTKALSLAPVANSDLELRINNWLFNEKIENRWPSSIGYITDKNLSLLKNKATSILNEKAMSALIFAKGGTLVDFIPRDKIFYNLFRLERRVWSSFKK